MSDDKFIKLAERSINMEHNAENGYMECFLGIIDILGFSDFGLPVLGLILSPHFL